jgi:hypothetical protein
VKFRRAVELAETWAETAAPPRGTVTARRYLPPVRKRTSDSLTWTALGLWCLNPDEHDAGLMPFTFGSVLAPILRELFPNPFIPLTWNSDCFTSTVRELSQHIYESRDFSAMPVLADALQDAGCDSEYILGHCRANRPHARGCWVLDAVLGKS